MILRTVREQRLTPWDKVPEEIITEYMKKDAVSELTAKIELGKPYLLQIKKEKDVTDFGEIIKITGEIDDGVETADVLPRCIDETELIKRLIEELANGECKGVKGGTAYRIEAYCLEKGYL